MDAIIEWLDNLQQYTYDLSESIAELFNEINAAVSSLNQFVQVGTYYIYGSGIVLLLLLWGLIMISLNIREVKLGNKELWEELQEIKALLREQEVKRE